MSLGSPERITGLSTAISNLYGGSVAAAGATLVFEALAANGSNVFTSVLTGAGSITPTHASTLYAPESDGTYNSFTANKMVVSGGTYTDEDTVSDTGSTYLTYYPAATNSQVRSNDLSNATWGKTNATCTFDQVGLTGAANTASVLGDNGATGTGSVIAQMNQTVTSGQNNVMKVWAKSKQLSQIALRQTNFDANGETYFNLSTGAVGTDTNDASEIVADGDWYICMMQFTTTTDVGGICRIYAIQTDGSLIVDLDGTSDVIIGNAELHFNKTIPEVRKLGPIFTTTAAVSTDETVYSPTANADKGDGLTYLAAYCEYIWDAVDAAIGDQTFVLYGASNNDLCLGINDQDAGGPRVKIKFGGNATSDEGDVVYSASGNKIGSAYGSTNGDTLEINYDGTWEETTGLSDGGLNTGQPYYIGKGAFPVRIRNLRLYSAPSHQASKDQIDTLMP